MNAESREGLEHLMAREARTCKVCGANFCATEENEFCPVCMLRRALAGGVESGESFS
jgi:rubrerythrin